MTKFCKQELARLITTIPTADPTTYQYQQLLGNIELFGSIAPSIDEWVLELGLDEPFTITEPIVDPIEVFIAENVAEAPTETEKNVAEAPVETEKNVAEASAETAEHVAEEPDCVLVISKEDVRKALGEARKKGIRVSDFLKQTVGVESFAAVPGEKYGELMTALEQL